MKNINHISLFCIILLLGLKSNAQHIVSFDITTDNYASETSWEILNAAGGQVAGVSSYSNNNNTYPTVDVDLPSGEYTFTIFDSFGDGICCGFGDGAYSLVDPNSGYIIIAGGSFGDSESITFTLPYVPPVSGCTNTDAINYNSLAEQDDDSCLFEGGNVLVDIELVANGFDNPTDILHANDDRLFIVEKDGTIKILNSAFETLPSDFLNISGQVSSGGERGLLGMAFHPDYATNGYFFVHYTRSDGTSRLSRFQVSADPNTADATSELIILEQAQPFSNHNAGAIAFGPDNYLYIPFGDGGSGGDPQDNGQDVTTWLGKMLRIDVDNSSESETYTIPTNNPFVSDPLVLDEIWAIGLRNPWRFSFDALTGDMWIGDVGQNAWEEINFEVAGDAGGRNYGWRCYEGNNVYNTSECDGIDPSDLTWPVSEYNHSNGACSVTGGYVYRGAEFGNMNGMFVYTDYCNGVFRGLKNQGSSWVESILTEALGFGWVTFGENSNLDLFVGKSNGSIYKIVDICNDFNATISGDEDFISASTGVDYTWYADNQEIIGFAGSGLVPDNGVEYRVLITDSNGCSALSAAYINLSCQADVVPDGEINILDLVAVSSDFGCMSNCNADTNGDDTVNVLDLIEISSNFGSTCF